MKKLNVKLLVAGIAGLTLLSTPSYAGKVTMNLGFGAPMKSVYGNWGAKFEKYAEEATNGTVDVKLRCCNSVATEDQGFKALQLGTVDGFIITGNNVSPHWPLMDVTVLPYIFQNQAHMDKVIYGEVGNFIKEQIVKDTGVHMLSIGPVVHRDFYNSKRPINSMADMKGLKIRVPKNKVMVATFEEFGASPVPLAWSETPTALQTGTVDGGDNGTTFIKDLKFYEHQKYFTVLEHFGSAVPILASKHFMKRLTPEQKKAVVGAAERATKELQAELMILNNQVRKWLTSPNGGGMTMTNPDLTDFVEAGKRIQLKVAAERGGQFNELVKKIQAAAN